VCGFTGETPYRRRHVPSLNDSRPVEIDLEVIGPQSERWRSRGGTESNTFSDNAVPTRFFITEIEPNGTSISFDNRVISKTGG
jgi:hypothetical protein